MADVEKLIGVANDTSVSSFHRRMAVAELARSKDAQAIDALTSLLDDDDAYLRREVVTGLARIEDSTVIEPLIRALDDEDDYLQRDAADALGRIGDGRAIRPLQDLLENHSYSVRDAAKRALEKIERRSPAPPPKPTAARPDAAEPDVAPTAESQTQSVADTEPDVDEDAQVPTRERQAEVPIRFEADSLGSAESGETGHAAESATAVAGLPSTPPLTPSPARVATPVEPIVAQVLPARPSVVPVVRQRETGSTARQTLAVDVGDWSRAKRFQTLFGDAVADLPALYTQLTKAESGILETEKQYRTVLQELGDAESASQDQLTRLDREIDNANTAIVKLRREGTRAKRSKYKAERESSSVAFQVSALFSSEKSRIHREQVKKVDAEIRDTDDQSAKMQEQLKTLQQQHDQLAHPLRQLQQQLETLSEQRGGARQAIGKASDDINIWMSTHLQRLPSETLRSRLDKLAEMSPDGDLFRTCTDELIRATTELQAHIAEREQNEAQMQQAAEDAEQTTNALGESIALGFRQTTIEQRANVRLSGSISFREEHGVFSGYSGASGTASGSGTGHASYTIDQLQWATVSDFGQRVAAFTETWSRCGDRGASGEMLDSLVAACKRRVKDLVRLIRAELERDFRGGPAR